MTRGLALAMWLGVAAMLPVPRLQAAQQEGIRVLSMPEAVLFGEPFEVVIERRWPVDAPPPAWSPAALAPLRVHTLNRISESGAELVERRRLRAWAFQTGELVFGERALSVLGALASVQPGAIEEPPLPAIPLPLPVLLARVGAVLSLLAASRILWRALRQRPRRVAVLPDGGALLRAWADAPRADDQGVALRSALDAAVLQATGIDARTRSGPELLAEPRVVAVVDGTGGVALAALRQALDDWRFAGRRPRDVQELATHARTIADALDAQVSTQEDAA